MEGQKRVFRGYEVSASSCPYCKGRGWLRSPRGSHRLTCRDCSGTGNRAAYCELISNREPAPRIKPEECQHLGVSSHEHFRGNGRAIKFVCNDCDSELRPLWQVVKK
jgi:hypothetical protein